MKVSDQLYIPLLVPTVQPKTPGVTTPGVSSNHGAASDDSHAEQGLKNEGGRSSQYPAASDQENQARYKRVGLGFKFPKPRFPKPKPKPELPMPMPKPPKPSVPSKKPIGGPNGVQGALRNSQSIGNLHNANAFTPLSSQLASSARNSLIAGGVGALINLPISVAEHLSSKALIDRIDAQAEMPGAEKKNADGTVTTVDPSATQKQILDAALARAESDTEVMANDILRINEGPDAKAVGQDPSAATDTPSRLTALEERMDALEEQMKDIGERYLVVYKPYVASDSSQAPTDESRMKNIKERYAHMKKMTKVLIVTRTALVGDEE